MGSPARAVRAVFAGVLAIAALLFGADARAWGEHEHVRISREAFEHLAQCAGPDCGYAEVLRREWTTLRERDDSLRTDEGKPVLCPDLIDVGRCIDASVLPMMAGDHSCTPYDLETSLGEEWVYDVLDVVEEKISETNQLLYDSDDPLSLEEERLEIRRELDVELQVADPLYISRAAGNSGHFAVPRNTSDITLSRYLTFAAPVFTEGVRQNTYGLYMHYHAWALYYATQASGDPDASVERRLAWLHEIYAIHFLQDAFSAGHIVGAPGEDGLRFGTHDHYCQHGLNASTWGGPGARPEAYVVHGDAFLLDADLKWASRAMVESLKQLAAAFAGPGKLDHALSEAEWHDAHDLPPVMGAVDTCQGDPLLPGHVAMRSSSTQQPGGFVLQAAMMRVFAYFPEPAVGPEPWTERGDNGVVPLPSFSAEYGVFVPFIIDLRFGGSFFPATDPVGETLVLNPEVYAGLGIGGSGEGIFSTANDAIAFVAPIGVLGLEHSPFAQDLGPTAGFGFRVRIPFAYLPGDVVVWGPLAAAQLRPGFVAFQRALSGGLFSSQSVFFAGPVRVQVDLGREFDVVWRSRAVRETDGRIRQNFGASQWDLTAPIVSTRFLKSFDGQKGISGAVRLSGRVGVREEVEDISDAEAPTNQAVAPTGAYVGLLLSVDTQIRQFIF